MRLKIGTPFNWHQKFCGFALVDPFIVSKMTLHGLINWLTEIISFHLFMVEVFITIFHINHWQKNEPCDGCHRIRYHKKEGKPHPTMRNKSTSKVMNFYKNLCKVSGLTHTKCSKRLTPATMKSAKINSL